MNVENNKVEVSGIIESELEFNNVQCGESFYKMIISVERSSGLKDNIPLLISERIINIRENYIGKYMKITGVFRSYNFHEENKSRLILYVFVKEWEIIDESGNINEVFLEGYICKEPVYRKTPLGREIADLLIAINRPYGKSDYIPCICWGRNARYVNSFKIGEHCAIWGRIQSREYIKKTDDEMETKIAYEVSISKLECIEKLDAIACAQ